MRLLTFAVAASVALVSALAWQTSTLQAQADDPFEGPPPIAVPVAPSAPVTAPPSTGGDATKPAEETDGAEGATAAPEVALPPGTIRIHLHDGSVFTGVMSSQTIVVETQFGRLTVPVDKIMSLTPGLDSQTGRMESLKKLIEQLGDASYSVRDKAEKDLTLMGVKIRQVLERYREDENAERRNRVQKILVAIDELAEEDPSSEEDPATAQPWQRLDAVVTESFTLAGTIQQKQFELESKHGKLRIALGDIRRLERPHTGREAYRRDVDVAGTNIAPRQYKNSQIVVQPGDRVTIKADGVIQMTPWGSGAMSTPDGAPNYGWLVEGKIASGALVMRTGTSGEPTNVGSKTTFTAKKAGTLYFGIGMNASYMNHSFPGTYNLKINVEPAGT